MTLSFPVALTPLLSMLLAIAVGGPFIAYLQRWKMGQSIRQEGPQSHHAKAGTPTMGGWLIVGPALVVATVGAAVSGALHRDVVAAMAVVLAYALIGWLDDYLIIKKRQNKGLSARQKLAAQIGSGALFAAYLAWSGHGTTVMLPVSHALWDLGWAYYPLLVLVMTSTTNAVNLTDGLDGLAAGTMAIAFGGLAWLVLHLGGAFPAQPGAVVLLLSLVGACLGFLWFNSHPAQVFMGDTGSLALGAAIAACAVLARLELFLIPLGAVFVAETLSVIAQVASFKTTGKRIFKMSPLHHHFELSGWAETKVVQRFYLVGALMAIVTVALL
ncbi:MAG TPA: phospho-N-acetylmuramoyl-pentapeptide-transferase [Pantanalinema sp.]